MSLVTFKVKSISATDIKSWPESPDRTSQNTGREAYASDELQKVLQSKPSKAKKLSEYSEILKKCSPFTLGAATLYRTDPVPQLMAQAGEEQTYITDDAFPPSKWYGSDVVSDKRVGDAIKNPKLYVNGPDMIDMSQQGLGNCGFVCTIGAVAVHPNGHNLLFSSIYPCVYNPIGIYSLRIVDSNEIGYLLVDDLIPQAGYSAMIDKEEFWYFIFEKAFAKLKNGYGKLGGGNEKYLGIKSTGNTSISKGNLDTVWSSKFNDIFRIGHRVTYQGTGSKPHYLVGGHAYAVIDAQEWNGIRLVRLHNPWNWANYKGPYAPGSTDWNNIPDSVQQSVFEIDRFDGRTFWMPYELYIADLPKISDMYLSQQLPDVLKSIANTNSIQN